jgi:hypothetical protein
MPPRRPTQPTAIAHAKRTDPTENFGRDSGGPAVMELVAL